VHVKIKKCRNPREYVERWNRDSTAPELYIAFTHVEPLGDASGADAGPLQGGVKACGKSASQTTVLTATVKVLDGLSVSIHLGLILSGVSL
jgi:hypothetical protein